MTIKRYRDSISTSTNVEVEKRVGKDGKSRPAKFKKADEKQEPIVDSAPSTFLATADKTESDKPAELPPEPVVESSNVDTTPEPPCPNKDVQYFPKTTLKLIPQESPRVLLVNLFEIFRKGFVEEMVIMAMDMLAETQGKEVVKSLLSQLNKKHGRK